MGSLNKIRKEKLGGFVSEANISKLGENEREKAEIGNQGRRIINFPSCMVLSRATPEPDQWFLSLATHWNHEDAQTTP